jgi:hypothetical protein
VTRHAPISPGGKPKPRVRDASTEADARRQFFFDCKLSPMELLIMGIALVVSLALQCEPVLKSAAAFPLIAALATMCWMTPVTGFFYIACAQSLPYPASAPFGLNPAQVGFVTWVFAAVVRYRRLRLRALKELWPVLPFLGWFTLVTGLSALHPTRSEYMKALLYALPACQLASESQGRYLKCLLGLCLGALTVTCAFWGAVLGLPIQLSEWGGEREGFVRLGGTRADSIMVWPPTLMGSFGILGIAFSALSTRVKRQGEVLKYVALGAFGLTLPPLAATMSNAAYLGWAIMIAWSAFMVASLHARGLLPLGVARRIRLLIVLLLTGIVVAYYVDAFEIRSRMEALKRNYEIQRIELGVAASRTDVWLAACQSIMNNPITGRANATKPEVTPRGYMPGQYLAHNVFLDYGRWAGLPSLILIAYFFFHPFVRMWRLRNTDRYIGFLLAYFAMFIFWMVLSFPFYKTFWALWMLSAITLANDPDVPKRRRRVARVKV